MNQTKPIPHFHKFSNQFFQKRKLFKPIFIFSINFELGLVDLVIKQCEYIFKIRRNVLIDIEKNYNTMIAWKYLIPTAIYC